MLKKSIKIVGLGCGSVIGIIALLLIVMWAISGGDDKESKIDKENISENNNQITEEKETKINRLEEESVIRNIYLSCAARLDEKLHKGYHLRPDGTFEISTVDDMPFRKPPLEYYVWRQPSTGGMTHYENASYSLKQRGDTSWVVDFKNFKGEQFTFLGTLYDTVSHDYTINEKFYSFDCKKFTDFDSFAADMDEVAKKLTEKYK